MEKITETMPRKNIWISTTGYRIFIELKALLEKPKTLEELISVIKNDSRFSKGVSADTVRFDINTMRAAGCIIPKPSKNNEHKYVLVSHPFNLTVEDSELNLLNKLREELSEELTVNEIFVLNDLYDKIAALTFNNTVIDEISNSKLLSGINLKLFKEFSNPKLTGRKMQIKYNSPKYGEENADIIFQKIAYENKKIYVIGYNFKYQRSSMFELSRILKINSVDLRTNASCNPGFTVVYEVFSDAVKCFEPKPNEKIIERDENKIRVQAEVLNEFMFTQRLLLLGSNFKIILPDFFREKLINKIKLIQKRYRDEEN